MFIIITVIRESFRRFSYSWNNMFTKNNGFSFCNWIYKPLCSLTRKTLCKVFLFIKRSLRDRTYMDNVIVEVRPQHRHLRHGLLRCVGPPRPECGAQAPQGRTCWLPPPPRQGGRNEMVPDQVSSSVFHSLYPVLARFTFIFPNYCM